MKIEPFAYSTDEIRAELSKIRNGLSIAVVRALSTSTSKSPRSVSARRASAKKKAPDAPMPLPPDGYVDNGDDCDDKKAGKHPGADEVCGDGDAASDDAGSNAGDDALRRLATALSATLLRGSRRSRASSTIFGGSPAPGFVPEPKTPSGSEPEGGC